MAEKLFKLKTCKLVSSFFIFFKMKKTIMVGLVIIAIVIVTGLILNFNIMIDGECAGDSECVPATCCHPKECVPKSQAPDCSDIFCSQECVPGTMDCGQGSCKCVEGKCNAMIN